MNQVLLKQSYHVPLESCMQFNIFSVCSPVKNPEAIPPIGWQITVMLALNGDAWNYSTVIKHYEFLPSHVAWSGVMDKVSSGLWAEFRPVSAGISIVEYAILKPKSTMIRFFTELAIIFFVIKFWKSKIVVVLICLLQIIQHGRFIFILAVNIVEMSLLVEERPFHIFFCPIQHSSLTFLPIHKKIYGT